MNREQDRELIYVGDPMCSWCWGFAPQLDQLTQRRFMPMRIVVGGLRAGPYAQPLSGGLVRRLREGWPLVAARSGQPFDTAVLERRDWVYDTGPPCRAVVAMREIDESLAWPLFKRIQRAFYAERTVPTIDVFPELVADIGGNRDEFVAVYETQATQDATQRDFALAAAWGITGFPTLIARRGNEGAVIAAGYTTAEEMDVNLTRALSPPNAAACEPGQIC